MAEDYKLFSCTVSDVGTRFCQERKISGTKDHVSGSATLGLCFRKICLSDEVKAELFKEYTAQKHLSYSPTDLNSR